MLDSQSLADLFADVVRCSTCSECGVPRILRDNDFNVPQPGYVGEHYEKVRVMFIGQNPGVSPEWAYKEDRRLADALGALARQPSPGTYRGLCSVLESFMHSWSITQNYLPLKACGLALEDIAYLNVARCRTSGNAGVPALMASNCIRLHLERWLDVLQPRVVVFLGKWAHDQAAPLVRARDIPYQFINRQRSLSTAERERNKADVARLVRGCLAK